MRLFFISILLLSCLGFAPAQDQIVQDSLELELKNADSDTLRIRIMLDLVKVYSTHNYPTAARYAKSAKDLAIAIDSKALVAKADRALAGVYFWIADYNQAANHFFSALKHYENIGDTVGIALLLINLGAVHDRLLEYDKALEYYLATQKLLSEASIKNAQKIPYLTSLYNNIANIYQTKGDFESARQYYEKALVLARESGNTPLEGIALNNLGKLYSADLKQPEKAIEYLTQGLEVRKRVGVKNEIAKSYAQLSSYYFEQKNYQEAERSAQMCIKLGEDVGSKEAQKDGYQTLQKIAEARGDYKNAYAAFKQYQMLQDSIEKNASSSEIARLQLQYDFEKAEQERVQERTLIKTRYTITIIILAAGLAIAVLTVIVIRARARQAELRQQNLRQDVEIKSKELTTNVMYLIRKNELINNVAERLLGVKASMQPENQKIIHDIIIDLQREADSDTWKEFEMRFNQVHSGFYDKLRKLHPGLSPSEEKICAFLRLNMSSKEIAAITKQHIKSVEVARTRLRKKLNLTNTNLNLITYLMNL